MKGYDVFYIEPGKVDEMICGVCGSRCKVRRNVKGPVSFASAMGRMQIEHDYFWCPNSEAEWHSQALNLVEAIEDTPSKRMAEIMRLDLEDILREHGCLDNSAALED